MKAVVQDVYGGPDVLELRDVDAPAVTDDDVLVRVHAASVNPADWHYMRGTPYIARIAFGLRKPTERFRGLDMAGHVEAVGKDVKQFQPGDEVFGSCRAAFAEYVCAEAKRFVPKPAGVTFEQAAAIPVAAITALQGLRDHGRIQEGQRVLINGAAGGVGTFAVQIAKSFGANVTGVCSTSNVDMVRSLGADAVIDYTQEDFTRSRERYDLLVDIAGNHSLGACRRVLVPGGTLVLVGGSDGRWIDGLGRVLVARLSAPFVRHKVAFFVARITNDDMVALKELIEAGKVTPVVDRTYPLSETAEAIRYLETRHARAKVVIRVP